ncbi:MAG: hypothetical protein M1819_000577 [Sarea resinae]|nr:MAG: hypothetical protein M1819_000577 [Sarea resinae]
MQSKENVPMSQSRRSPPAALHLQTGSGHGSYDVSPPRTPPSHNPRQPQNKVGSRALHPRETFLDDITPVESHRMSDGYDPPGRDSHDLSLSPRHVTRDSVVDNMLLSLDQFSIGGTSMIDQSQFFSTSEQDDPYATSSRYASSKSGRHRGHTYSSSYSSDYDPDLDETSGRYASSQFSRRQRSNSSSNFQSGLGRIDSLRAGTHGLNEDPDEEENGALFNERPSATHSRGGKKGNKGSGSSSLDYGHSQVLGTMRWASSIDKRSTGYDRGYGDRVVHSSQSSAVSNTLAESGRPQYYTYNSFDAAPTPTVPAGPRRHHSPSPPLIYPPQPNHAPPQTPILSRKQSATASENTFRRPSRLDTPVAHSIKADELRHASSPRDVPAMPAFLDPPAPSPTVSYEKPSILDQGASPPARDRPGFFRRVFGSSKSNTHAPGPSSRAPQLPPVEHAGSRPTTRPATHESDKRSVSQLKSSTKTPPRDSPLAKEQGPVLNKKPSSFFRRIKKSSNGNNPPPALPMQIQIAKEADIKSSEPSPVGSLFKAMNPYLNSPPRSPGVQNTARDPRSTDDEAHAHQNRETPSGTASRQNRAAGALRTGPRGDEFVFSSAGEGRLNLSPASNTPAKMNEKRRLHARGAINDTFLQENSGIESRSRDTSNIDQKMPEATSAPLELVGNLPSPEEHLDVHEEIIPAKSSFKQNISPKASIRLDTHIPSQNDDEFVSPAPSEELLGDSSRLSLPLEGPRSSAKSVSTTSDYKSASSLPLVQVGNDDGDKVDLLEDEGQQEPVEIEEHIPTAEDRDRAQKIFDGNEEFVDKARAAALLGESTPAGIRIRKAYMELFDWSGLNILTALRDLCGKLVLRAESQQVDRLLEAFSARWCTCNPNHGFKAPDVVHTICFSLLLLNTDLHIADIEQKMTRNQFIKNTLPTIRRVATDAAPDAFETIKPSNFPFRGQIPWMEPSSPGPKSPTFPNDAKESRTSAEAVRPTYRLSTRPSQRSGLDENLDPDRPLDTCGPLVKEPFTGTSRAWESQVETVLKEFYHSIRQQRLPLHGASLDRVTDVQASSNNLSVNSSGTLRRSPSTLSKAPSENPSYRSRPAELRNLTGRWTSKTRSRPRVYPHSTAGSSRTSLDEQSSLWSPSASSSTWSKYSLGRPQNSMSVDSFGSGFPQADYQQSIGFANALSQAIIREEATGSSHSDEGLHNVPLLEDETLELAGAPWAKEGIVKHKHHLEAIEKRAKDRGWTENFAVVEKGYMRLFSFSKSSSMKVRKNRQTPGLVVGGGNWSENAEAIGSFMLRQTIASALPPPGYSKARPHVWALSLPSGAVHLFQVGTPEIVKEFVTTANYWSARLSKEPLVGGISNIEYGWSEAVLNSALVGGDGHGRDGHGRDGHGRSASASGARPSLQSSIRSSLDQAGPMKPRLPADRILISDWTPPPQSMTASALLEVDQLKALSTYVKNVEEELRRHNDLRAPMTLAYTNRHPNSAKAMSNWEKKSSYLLREIVKFSTYIDCLTAAQVQKEKIYAERPQMPAVATVDNAAESSGDKLAIDQRPLTAASSR